MPEIQLLRADHAAALRAFESENRAYFAESVPDRGDAYFTGFAARHEALLAEQAAGLGWFHLVVDGDGEVLGRVNLIDAADGEAELGFRIARKAAGRGLATDVVRRICVRAASEYGLTSLRAAATLDNAASRAVLIRAGFVAAGETVLDGRPARCFTLALAVPTGEGHAVRVSSM